MPPLATTVRLVPISSAGVLAFLQVTPFQAQDFGLFDALNDGNWAVSSNQDQAPGLYIAEAAIYPATSVGCIAGKTFNLTFSRALVPGALYTVSESNLQDNGTEAAAGTPIAAANGTFVAIATALPLPSPQTILYGTDIANPPQFGDRQVTVAGDYATVANLDSIKQRIFRRLDTDPDGFSFPEYVGYGIGASGLIKKLARDDIRRELISRCQRQIPQEPGVLKVDTSLVQVAPGLSRLNLNVKTVAGNLALTYPRTK